MMQTCVPFLLIFKTTQLFPSKEVIINFLNELIPSNSVLYYNVFPFLRVERALLALQCHFNGLYIYIYIYMNIIIISAKFE